MCTSQLLVTRLQLQPSFENVLFNSVKSYSMLLFWVSWLDACRKTQLTLPIAEKSSPTPRVNSVLSRSISILNRGAREESLNRPDYAISSFCSSSQFTSFFFEFRTTLLLPTESIFFLHQSMLDFHNVLSVNTYLDFWGKKHFLHFFINWISAINCHI